MYTLPNLNQIVSNVSDYDPNALKISKALQIINDFCSPISKDLTTETVEIFSAIDRVLAYDLVSPINVPNYDNSAMDGYAFNGSNLTNADDYVSLKIVGETSAGNVFNNTCPFDGCVRIMTGSVMPKGCDTVIPQELVKQQDGQIIFLNREIRPGDNCRRTGEDLAKGKIALKAGQIIRPAELGLISSLGYAEISVRRRLRVAFFSTGNELRSVGIPLDPGCIYDSNRHTIFGMLTRLGVDLIDMGIIPDNRQDLELALQKSASLADVIITSGGISVGESDFMKKILKDLDDVALWNISMKPGRHMGFGGIKSNSQNDQDDSAILFALPGNPVAVMVLFYIFVRHGLLSMMSVTNDKFLPTIAINGKNISKKIGIAEYRRGRFFLDIDGKIHVKVISEQGSGILRSMSDANCLVFLDYEISSIDEGSPVIIFPFEGLV